MSCEEYTVRQLYAAADYPPQDFDERYRAHTVAEQAVAAAVPVLFELPEHIVGKLIEIVQERLTVSCAVTGIFGGDKLDVREIVFDYPEKI